MTERSDEQAGTVTSVGCRSPTNWLSSLAAEAEAGYDVQGLRRRGGRPPLGSAPLRTVLPAGRSRLRLQAAAMSSVVGGLFIPTFLYLE
jgi:hypothetical protein